MPTSPSRATTLVRMLAIFFAMVAAASAQEWPRFRGANGAGIGHAPAVPNSWSEKDLDWKITLPGAGHSSPVLWGQKVFVTSARADKATLFCIESASGRVLWQKPAPFENFEKHNYNSHASGTPAVDSTNVYLCMVLPKAYTVTGFDQTGRQLWQTDLGPFKSQHGGGHSPIVHHGMVIVANEQDGESFVAALDAGTGKIRWKTPRRTAQAAYATPCIYTPRSGPTQVILAGEAHGIASLNVQDGKPLWEYNKAFNKRVVSSPLIAGDLIVGSCGSGGGGNYAVAIRPADGSGALPELAYEIRKSAPYVPTPLYHPGTKLLFLWSDGGIVTCANSVTGEIKYQERVNGNFFSSPVLLDDRVLNISTRGEAVTIEASETFRVLGRTALNDVCHSTPAVANERLYIRTAQHLMCISGKKIGQ